MSARFVLALLLAAFLDLADLMVVGFIPVMGNLLDVIGVVVLFPLVGIYSLVGFAELVPLLGDLPP